MPDKNLHVPNHSSLKMHQKKVYYGHTIFKVSIHGNPAMGNIAHNHFHKGKGGDCDGSLLGIRAVLRKARLKLPPVLGNTFIYFFPTVS